jgi:phospholipid transport system transporter-binding protein
MDPDPATSAATAPPAAPATALPASLTLRDAQAALDALRDAFTAAEGECWRVDAGAVVQLDSSALAVLLECARIAAAGGRRLEILNIPPRLADLARLYNVDEVLHIPPVAATEASGLPT